MKFLIDNQLPISLAIFIKSRGFEAQHVIDLKLDTSSDQSIWDFASKNNWIVVSKDEDFFHIAKMHPKTVQLIWVRIGNCRSCVLLSAFERLWGTLEAGLQAKEDVIEIR